MFKWDYTDIHWDVSKFFILSFSRGFDHYHFGKDDVFANTNLGEITTKNDPLL